MDSLQGAVHDLGLQEGLAVGDEAHVGCDVVVADFLSVESSHGGSAVANENAVPVERMLVDYPVEPAQAC